MNRGKRLEDVLGRAVVPALALVTALLLGALLIVLTDFEDLQHLGTDPLGALGGAIGLAVHAYGALLAGTIGDPARIAAALQGGTERELAAAIRPLTEALLSATPLIFVGLAVGVAFHAGLINLGADGQFLIGGLGATIGAIALGGLLPAGAVLVGALAVGTLFGAAYGFLPGVLKAKTGAHEVITTLMLNTVAAQVVIYAVRSGAVSSGLPAIARVPRLVDLPTVRLDWGFVAALVIAAVVSFVLVRTTLGFEIRAMGFSRTVARYAGMRPVRTTILALSLSGALAGLGGAFLVLGPAGGLSISGQGLVALALALIARLRPSGIVVMALLYGALNNGAKRMVIETGIPLDLLVVVITVVLTFTAAPSLVGSIWRTKVAQAPEMAPLEPPSSAEPL